MLCRPRRAARSTLVKSSWMVSGGALCVHCRLHGALRRCSYSTILRSCILATGRHACARASASSATADTAALSATGPRSLRGGQRIGDAWAGCMDAGARPSRLCSAKVAPLMFGLLTLASRCAPHRLRLRLRGNRLSTQAAGMADRTDAGLTPPLSKTSVLASRSPARLVDGCAGLAAAAEGVSS